MKKKLIAALALIAIIGLSGCSESSSIQEGTFVPYLSTVKMDNSPLTIFKDGTGYDSVFDSQFKWNISGEEFHATPEDSMYSGGILYRNSDENNLEYRNGYIVMKDSAFSGKIPSGTTFDTTISDDSENLHFLTDGTLIVSWKDSNDIEGTYTYTRNNDFIITDYWGDVGEPAYFLVTDGTMYTNYFCPESKLPDGT